MNQLTESFSCHDCWNYLLICAENHASVLIGVFPPLHLKKFIPVKLLLYFLINKCIKIKCKNYQYYMHKNIIILLQKWITIDSINGL
jgi:hypothetical protein